MIKFKALKIRNFQCFESVDLTYEDTGLVLVLGVNEDSDSSESNAAGKTALIVESLLWCLWEEGTKIKSYDGATVSGRRLDEVVRRGASKCEIHVTFSVDDQDYVVTRARSKTKSELKLLRKSGDKLENIPGKSKADTQANINHLIGSFNTFQQTALFGQGARRFTHLKDAERKELLEDLLELDLYTKAWEHTRGVLKDFRATLSDLNKDIAIKETMSQQVELRFNQAEKTFLQQKGVLSSWNDSQKKKIDKANEELKQICKELRTEQGSVKEGKDNIDGINAELKTLPELSTLQKKVQFLKETKEALIEVDASEKTRRDGLGNSLEYIQENSSCPMCYQDIPDDFDLTKIQEEIDKLQGSVEKTEGYFNQLNEDLRKVMHDRDKVEQLAGSLSTWKRSVAAGSKRVERLQTRFGKKKAEIENLREEELPKAVDESVLDSVRQEHLDAFVDVEQTKLKRDKLVDVVKDHEFWEFAFSNKGIKSLLLDGILPFLNNCANDYCTDLLGGDVRISFDTEVELASGEKRDRFDVQVTSLSGEGYHICSGGQRARVDFCVAMALHNLVKGKFKMLVLDEPFESVDATGAEAIVQTLQNFSLENDVPVYIISHQAELKSLISNTLTVVKQGGTSNVIVEKVI